MLVSVVFYVWAGGVSAVWVEICGVKDDGGGCETAEPVVGEGRRGLGSLPFRLISAFWVEISNRQLQESLPFRPVFPDLGRDFQPAATGFSTFSAGSPPFG